MVARKQCLASLMVWAAVTESGRCSLFSVDQGLKRNQQNYRDGILVGALLPWTRERFKKRPWSFQQDSAPSHGAKKTQEWLSENVEHFITKEEWAKISQKVIRDSCKAFSTRLQLVIDADDGHIE